MTQEQINKYQDKILSGASQIYKRTLIGSGDYILFKGEAALEIYEGIKQYNGWNRFILVPCRHPKRFKPSTIEIVSPGSYITYIFDDPSKEEIQIPEIHLISTKERQPDFIWTIIVEEN